MSPQRNINRARKELSVAEKIKVINYAEDHTERNTAAVFGISKTAVNSLKKHKNELMTVYEADEEARSNRYRRFHNTSIITINNKTWEWFQEMKKNGDFVTTKLIKEKALSYAREAGLLNFSASNGWLESLKLRYGVVLPGAKSKPTAHNNQINLVAESFLKRKMDEKAALKRYRNLSNTDIITINNHTWEWVQQMKKNGEPITTKLIKEKALSYAHEAGLFNFSASNGWLESFKVRYGVVLAGAKSKSTTRTNQINVVAESLSMRQGTAEIKLLSSDSQNSQHKRKCCDNEPKTKTPVKKMPINLRHFNEDALPNVRCKCIKDLHF